MRLLFGTVVRTAAPERGGELCRLDWDTKGVEGRTPVVAQDPSVERDPNPRGSTRGCRGIQITGDEIVAASYHSLHVYDRSLTMRRRISHGLMAGLHEILLSGPNRIWVTSTAIDAVLEYDLRSGALLRGFWPREIRTFREKWSLEPLPIDKQADNRLAHLRQSGGVGPSHLHVNAVALWRGRLLGLVRVHGAVVDLEAGEILIEDPRIRGGHNLALLDDDATIVIADTRGQTVRLYELGSRRLVKTIELRAFPWIDDLGKNAQHLDTRLAKLGRLLKGDPEFYRPLAAPLFVRGLAARGDLMWIGMSPAAVVCIDWRRGTLEGTYAHSRDVRECVHGLALEA